MNDRGAASQPACRAHRRLRPASEPSGGAARSSGLTLGQGLSQIDHLVTNQASMLAANDIFWISGWLFLVLIVSVWLTRKPFGAATMAAH
jgi:hypothetical protein